MNIFATSFCPRQSAEYLDDQRLVKMPLECCQMLGTVAAFFGSWNKAMCKPTHVYHPCVLWTARSRENFEWLWEHAQALDNERMRRFRRLERHATVTAYFSARIWEVASRMPSRGLTQFANCARHSGLKIDYSHVFDPTMAYSLYLRDRQATQKKPPRWTRPTTIGKGAIMSLTSKSNRYQVIR